MRSARSGRIAALVAIFAVLAFPALAQTVKVTPLGGIDGEFCPRTARCASRIPPSRPPLAAE